jgi:hypothetical protein
MNKSFHLIISIFLLISVLQLNLNAQSTSNTQYIHETIHLSQPTITIDNEFTIINLPNSHTYLQKIGAPIIPTITKTYYLPFKTEINTIDITLTNTTFHHLTNPPKPMVKPQPITTANPPSTEMNPAIYSSEQPFPNQEYTSQIGTGLYNNEHMTILTLTIYPIQYHPADKILEIAEKITFTIKFTSPQTPFKPLRNSNDLTIITTEEFAPMLQSFIDHKNKVGITTQLTVDTDIYDHYQGRDSAEKIKYFIKDMVETQDTQYILIVGGVLHIPMRYTAIDVWDENFIPTDLYYADIYDSQGNFCSWDSNQNDLFGEFDWDLGPIDQVDLYPDIYIGRLPCTTIKEVTDIANKIIIYETTTYGSNWFNKIIYMAGDTFPNHGNIEGEFVTNKIIEQRPEFNPIKIWTSQGNYRPLTINLAISQGAGFVSYSGHGYEQGFGTSEPNVEKRIEYYSPYLMGLFNKNKFPIVFFDACSTTKLDFNMQGFEEWYPVMSTIIKTLEGNNYDPNEHFPCFSWQIMKKPTTGAIATIGATRVAFTHVNSGGIFGGAGYLNLHFFMAYEPGITIAEMFTIAQNDYISNVGMDCVTLEEFILLGDPSLRTGGY